MQECSPIQIYSLSISWLVVTFNMCNGVKIPFKSMLDQITSKNNVVEARKLMKDIISNNKKVIFN